jgi:prepilin peptidase CpaA
VAVACGGGASALVDLRTRRVPNALTLGISIVGLTLATGSWGRVTLASALIGCAVALLLMMPGHLIGATGAGDVKLFAALGTLVGPQTVLAAFFYTAIAGGLLAVAVAVLRRRLRNTVERTADLVRTGGANVAEIEHASQDNRFAYAPAIAVGTLLAALGI